MTPEVCPNCGAEVPPKAKVCPECGADEQTGWSEKAYADNLGLPDEKFDYDEFVKEEFGPTPSRAKPHGISWLWWVIALVIAIVVSFAFLSGMIGGL